MFIKRERRRSRWSRKCWWFPVLRQSTTVSKRTKTTTRTQESSPSLNISVSTGTQRPVRSVVTQKKGESGKIASPIPSVLSSPDVPLFFFCYCRVNTSFSFDSSLMGQNRCLHCKEGRTLATVTKRLLTRYLGKGCLRFYFFFMFFPPLR